MTSDNSHPHRKILIVFSVVALIVMLFGGLIVFSHIHWKKATKARLAELAAQGIPTTLEEINRRYHGHGFESAENASPVYDQAFALMDSDKIRDAIPSDLFKYENNLKPIDPETFTQLTELISDHETALAFLKKSSAYPYLRRNLDFTEGHELLVPHVGKLRTGVRLLAIEAVVAGQEGDSSTADEALAAIFRITTHLADEPTLISFLTMIACEYLGLVALERVLFEGELDLQTVASVEQSLRKLEGKRSLQTALSSELPYGLSIYDLEDLSVIFSRPSSSNILKLIYLYRLSSLMAQDRFGYIEIMYEYIGFAKLTYTERLKVGIPSVEISSNPINAQLIQEIVVPTYDKIFAADMLTAARARAALIALAAERFRLTTGDYPKQLDELVPDYLDVLPIDPYSSDGRFEWIREDALITIRSQGQAPNESVPVQFRLRTR